MMTIGSVWDRTTEVIAGRAGELATLAFSFLAVPAIVRTALVTSGTVARTGPANAVLGIVAAVLTVFGLLAITAVASDPVVGRYAATVIARRRLLPAIGLIALAIVILAVLAIPAYGLLLSSGFDMTRAQAGLQQPDLDAGRVGLVALYALLLVLLGMWANARLLPLLAVIVAERRGLGAFGRSWRLTRGVTWRLVGVLILYLIVAIVVLMAATTIVGVVSRLALGADHAALVAFLVAVTSAVVGAGLSVVQSVFAAQVYVAARGAQDGAPVPA